MIIDSLDNYVKFAPEVGMYCWCEWHHSIVEELGLLNQEQVTQDIINNNICFVAIDETCNELMGFICVGKCDFPSRYFHLTPWIQNFYVLPQYRKQRVGSRLFDRALEYCRETKVSTVYLWTYEKHLQYYQNRGFTIISRADMPDGLRYVMCYLLKN